MIRTRRALYHLILPAVLIASAPALAQEAVEAEPVAKNIQPEADAVLRAMGDLLSQTGSFKFLANVSQDVQMTAGMKMQVHKCRQVTVARPGRIFATGDTGVDRNRAWFKDGLLSVLDPDRGVYAQIEGPEDIDGMLDFLALEKGWVMPLSDLVVSDPYASATARVRLGLYLGQHHVRGTLCDHLAFRQEGIDWQLWVEAGDRPVPRKLLITFTELAGHPRYIAELDEWDLEPEIEEGLFDFEAPDGASQVDFEEFRDS